MPPRLVAPLLALALLLVGCSGPAGPMDLKAPGDTAPACQGNMGTCATTASCCAGLVCGRVVTFCRTPQNLDIGDPCTADAQCIMGEACDSVLHACSETCKDISDCGAGVCLVTSRGFQCVAACADDTDCAGTGLHCRSSTDPGGMAGKGCF